MTREGSCYYIQRSSSMQASLINSVKLFSDFSLNPNIKILLEIALKAKISYQSQVTVY